MFHSAYNCKEIVYKTSIKKVIEINKLNLSEVKTFLVRQLLNYTGHMLTILQNYVTQANCRGMRGTVREMYGSP